jgi:hypothetical protein
VRYPVDHGRRAQSVKDQAPAPTEGSGMKICANPPCAAVFEPRGNRQVFCSRQCSQVFHNSGKARAEASLKAEAATTRTKEIRSCLRCQKPFASLGTMNRLCKRCGQANRSDGEAGLYAG